MRSDLHKPTQSTIRTRLWVREHGQAASALTLKPLSKESGPGDARQHQAGQNLANPFHMGGALQQRREGKERELDLIETIQLEGVMSQPWLKSFR